MEYNAVFRVEPDPVPKAERLIKHNLNMLDDSKIGWYYSLVGNAVKSKPHGVDGFYLQVEQKEDYVVQTLYSANFLPNTVFVRTLVKGKFSDWISNDDEAFQYDAATVRQGSNLQVTLKTNTDEYVFTIDVAEAQDEPIGLPIYFEVVDELPLTGRPNIIYLVKNDDPEDNNAFLEWAWIENEWEQLGYRKMDMSGYWAKTEMTPIDNKEMDELFAERKAKKS